MDRFLTDIWFIRSVNSDGGRGAMITPRLICQASWPLHKLAAHWGEGTPWNTSLIYVIVGIDIMQGQEEANLPVGINDSRFFQKFYLWWDKMREIWTKGLAILVLVFHLDSFIHFHSSSHHFSTPWSIPCSVDSTAFTNNSYLSYPSTTGVIIIS